VPLSGAEERLCAAVEARRDELVALASDLVGFDTTARHPHEPAREEAALQEHLAARLRAAGAQVDVWEPAPEDVAGSRQVPPGLGFAGRPQLVARFAGSGGGRSLMFNGHIDAVPVEPRALWTSDPFRAEVRDGNLHGRGACDMKGGVAAMVLAAEVLAAAGVQLAGDLLVCTVTDEESSGAGGIAAVAHGVRADAGIVTEPTSFEVWVACRGTVLPTFVLEGRAAHAELAQPHWRAGGAVNAIEKAGLLLGAVRALRDEWRTHPDHRHRYLSPGDLVPTTISGGEWDVTYPSECRVGCDLMYLPGHADADGWGTEVERFIEEWIARFAQSDPWLAGHPPRIEWTVDIPPFEVDPAHEVVDAMLGASQDLGVRSDLGGLDSWFDAATFTRFGDTPSIGYGPRGLERGHTIDEYVPVDDLVKTAQALAVAAVRFCGQRGG
jgi:acetylornithine deacetylase